MSAEILQMLQRIERKQDRMADKLSTLANGQNKSKWVKAHELISLTIWKDNNGLRRARTNNYVTAKKTGKFYAYDLNSIDKRFLENRTI